MNRELTRFLLEYDLVRFVEGLGYESRLKRKLVIEHAVRMTNYAEALSHRPADEAARVECLTICGLLWEHGDPSWTGLTSVLVQVLSRLGLAPSATMVDPEYKSSGQFAPLGSWIRQLRVTARQIQAEVSIGSEVLLLSDFQSRLWHALAEPGHVAVSAPTSAGKSFVLAHKVVHLLMTGARVIIYIVPTLTLISQVTQDIRKALRAQNLAISVRNSLPEFVDNVPSVYVLTQERAQTGLARAELLPVPSMLIVDEVQNIERVSGDMDQERANILLDVVLGFVAECKPARVVVAGPRLVNLGAFADRLLGGISRTISDDLPPVVNLTYALAKSASGVCIRQHSTAIGVIETSLTNSPIDIRIFKDKRFTDAVLGTLAHMAMVFARAGGVLVFSPNPAQAMRTAQAMTDDPQYLERHRDRIGSLAQYLAESVHPHYGMVETIRRGVGFHHGKVPQHVRVVVEKAFSRGVLRILTCTTTLLQGVNLPAKTLLVRDPRLYVRAPGPTLSSYDFANLRGRAGRLMKDFVGRAVVLDEASFDDAQVSMDFVEKELPAGYRERFNKHSEQIRDDLVSMRVGSDVSANADLVIYVRQIVYRYGANANRRLLRVGIELDSGFLDRIRDSLRGVSVPIPIAAQCSAWDPLALQKLKESIEADAIPQIPDNPMARGFAWSLELVVLAVKASVPDQAMKYFPKDKYLRSICISAQNWVREEPLSQLIGWGAPDAHEIDTRIALINGAVMFDLPRLLKPVALLRGGQTGILGLLEMGAYRPFTRQLLERGLPRELAVRVSKLARYIWPDLESEVTSEGLRDVLEHIRPQLGEWEATMLDDLGA